MRRIIPLVLLFPILLATYFVYLPGLTGDFIFDDSVNISANPHLQIQNLNFDALRIAAFSVASGPLMRPISMLTFALNYYVSGFNPYYFKLTNLIIHMMNGVGIYALSTLIFNIYQRRFSPNLSRQYLSWTSLAIASAWLLHPFNLTSVLYVVQRMTSLSAFFSIWGLTIYLYGRTRLFEGRSGKLIVLSSLLLFTPLAALSKETGALLPLLMLVTEITLFNFQTQQSSARSFLIGFFSIAVALPALAVLIYTVFHPQWIMMGYASRGFTLAERLLTEARVLWFYTWQILLPSINQMSLYHDDILNSTSLFQPISTVLSVIGSAALLVISFVFRKKAPLISFGLLFFFSGHILESSIFPLEIAHEHRNYLPMYGLVLILFFYLLYPLNYLKNLRLRQVVTVLFIGVFAFDTFSRAQQWANPFDLAQSSVEHHPNSVRSNMDMADIYDNIETSDQNAMEVYYQLAQQHYANATKLDSNDVQGLISLIIANQKRNKPIDPSWLNELQYRIERSTITNNDPKRLLVLVACQEKGTCKLTDENIQKLFQGALNNPHLKDWRRAEVLTAYSIYLNNVLHDYARAVEAMFQAVEVQPKEIDYRLNLSNLLIALQRFDEARLQLDAAEKLDKLQIRTNEINRQNKLIAENSKSHVQS
jgi:hypothetical protein